MPTTKPREDSRVDSSTRKHRDADARVFNKVKVKKSKKSVTIPAQVAAEVEAQVGPREFSAYVTEAVVRKLEHDRLSALVDELTETFGEVPEDVASEVDRQWRDALG